MSNSNATTTTGILCGKCKGRHPSAADVKACYMGASAVQDDIDMARMEAAADTAEAETAAAAKWGAATPEKDFVPAGHYVVTIDGIDKFYRVGYGKEGGKWAGFCFIDVQASDEYYPVKNRSGKAAILFAIRSQGVRQCLARYGHALGKCGICNRTLTDPDSIANGIGPVCAAGL